MLLHFRHDNNLAYAELLGNGNSLQGDSGNGYFTHLEESFDNWPSSCIHSILNMVFTIA
jgi:hypothetical protein